MQRKSQDVHRRSQSIAATPHPVVLDNPGTKLCFDNLSFSIGGGKRTLVTLELNTLTAALVCPSEAQRCEWARFLLLQAHQSEPSASLHHLYSSIQREGWGAQRDRAPSADAHDTSQRRAADASDRMALADDLNRMAEELRRFMRTGESVQSDNVKVSAAAVAAHVSDDGNQKEDVLRASVTKPRLKRAARDQVKRRRGVAADMRAEQAVVLATPKWMEGAVSGRVQATLRFKPPGLCAGDSAMVTAPNGERLRLTVPPGMMHVQRALASLSSNPREAGEQQLTLDVVTLPRSLTSADVIKVGGVQLWPPPYAAPATCLVVAIPMGKNGSML